MNLTQLTVFREVMETGSISQTAKKLNRTQPAISLASRATRRSQSLLLPVTGSPRAPPRRKTPALARTGQSGKAMLETPPQRMALPSVPPRMVLKLSS